MVKDSEKVKVKVKEGGTIRIGATGKVSALMMQELETNIKSGTKKPVIKSQRIQTEPVSVDCGGSTKRLQKMMSLNNNDSRGESVSRKKENMKNVVQKIPMLESEDLWIDKTPVRGKECKKVARRIVETVDLKCGKNDGDWYVNPIGNQLRRLSFSKILD